MVLFGAHRQHTCPHFLFFFGFYRKKKQKKLKNLQVLEVTAGKLIVGNDLNLAIANLGDLDGLAEVANTALDLDPLVQELLKSGNVEDLVRGGLGSVDDELLGDLGALALGGLLL